MNEGAEGLLAPASPIPQVDDADRQQLEADAAASHAAWRGATQKHQEDEDAIELLRAEQEEAVALAAVQESAKQSCEEWTVAGSSMHFQNESNFRADSCSQ